MKNIKKRIKSFPFLAQHDSMDCGPACLAMITRYYGKSYPLTYLRERSYLTREGVSLMGISQAAETIGMETAAFHVSVEELIEERPDPCILFWRDYHFVVLYKIKKHNFKDKYYFIIVDPSVGFVKMSTEEFKESWEKSSDHKGVVLLLHPTAQFYKLSVPSHPQKSVYTYLCKYIYVFKKQFFTLLFSIGTGSLITLILPFLTQLIIDKGIATKQINIVILILIAQLFIFSGSIIIEIVRNWLILYIGASVNIHILSDYLKKIIRLPMKFFDTKFLNDFYQRILDHSRIEIFLTSQTLTTFFSLTTFLIFLFVLLKYNPIIFIIYTLFTLVAITWSLLFMKKREHMDYIRFKHNCLTQESINELIGGIQEIKLNNFEAYKIDKWKKIQLNTFQNNQNILKLNQIQTIGFEYINQIKNIFVSFYAAKLVIEETLSLGEMMSISFIIGQLNSPINQLIDFFKSFQDAKLSLLRLLDIQENENEEKEGQFAYNELPQVATDEKGITMENVSFQYEDPSSPFVLKNINLYIPQGKTTAIVGTSGCGKTTLLKLLIGFYTPNQGTIRVNGMDLRNISPSAWRKECGVVMQDTYIFSETIARNIAMADLNINDEKLKNALTLANIDEFVETLTTKHHTIIGARGNDISNGQRQRLLIARTIYKNPQYIFLDEATSSLDTENEKIIYDNMCSHFKNKTVVVIAHRLSTIKHADQIVVLQGGQIVERGKHAELMKLKGAYYKLIKNQLEFN